MKQILTMFITIDTTKSLHDDKDLINFILKKESCELSDKYQVYLYNTLSNKKRMMGIQWNNFNGHFSTHSEITFNPLGYLLTVNSLPTRNDLCNITSFKNFKYNEENSGPLLLPYLNIESPFIGKYE